jgi:hypothetical protein
MNAEEGERALGEARRALANGNILEGLKYLKISQRLLPSNETLELIRRYSQTPSQTQPPHSQPQTQSQSNTSNPFPSQFQNLTQSLQEVTKKLSEIYLQFENKYISPSMRQFIRRLFLIVFMLIIVKYIFKQKIGLGQLPGDISYSSSSTFISAPFVSCLLVSFLFNGLMRAFQS